MGFDQSELVQGPIYNIILNNLSISVFTAVSQTKLIRREKFKSTLTGEAFVWMPEANHLM